MLVMAKGWALAELDESGVFPSPKAPPLPFVYRIGDCQECADRLLLRRKPPSHLSEHTDMSLGALSLVLDAVKSCLFLARKLPNRFLYDLIIYIVFHWTALGMPRRSRVGIMLSGQSNGTVRRCYNLHKPPLHDHWGAATARVGEHQ